MTKRRIVLTRKKKLTKTGKRFVQTGKIKGYKNVRTSLNPRAGTVVATGVPVNSKSKKRRIIKSVKI